MIRRLQTKVNLHIFIQFNQFFLYFYYSHFHNGQVERLKLVNSNYTLVVKFWFLVSRNLIMFLCAPVVTTYMQTYVRESVFTNAESPSPSMFYVSGRMAAIMLQLSKQQHNHDGVFPAFNHSIIFLLVSDILIQKFSWMSRHNQ